MRFIPGRYAAFVFAMCWALGAFGNNLRVTNTAVVAYQPEAGLVHIRFDLAWENSWRYTNINHDAAWVFFKARKEGDVSNTWIHLKLEGTGTNPVGYSTGTGTGIEMIVPDDGVGVFVRRAGEGSGPVSVTNASVLWNYVTNGLSHSTKVKIQTLAIEMVYVAQGSFYVGGTNGTETRPFRDGPSTGMPFHVQTEAQISVSNQPNCLWGDSFFNDSTVGPEGVLSNAFPKGYAAFYCMKYEVTQGQYADFLNLLTRIQQNTRTRSQVPTNFAMTATAVMTERNCIRCPADIPGSPANIVFGCDGNLNMVFNENDDAMDRACNYLPWKDGAAFADWSGLRPMTELEFEKACRGTNTSVASEFAWGTSSFLSQTGYVGTDGSGTETALPANANCNFGMGGPVRVGIYATGTSVRTNAGASYWGIMELCGNVWERTVGIGILANRSFMGLMGDGSLDANGNANVASWPPASYGAGGRGGCWALGGSYFLTSDRRWCSGALSDNYYGFRGVRTAPVGVGP